MQTFDIYFRAELLPGADPAEVRAAIGKRFRMDEKALDRLFSGKPKRIKSDVDVDKASRYRAAFRDMGALIDIVPAGSPPPTQAPGARGETGPAGEKTPKTEDSGKTFDLLPPRTGSLEDCAPAITPMAIADIDWMQLDEVGVTLEARPPQPEPEFDLSGLSVSQPRSFTLEDCAEQRPAVELPDISHLSLAEPGRDSLGG